MGSKGRQYIRNEASSNLPCGDPLAPTSSRPNRRIRLWELESENHTVRSLERAYLQALAEVDKLSAHRADIAKSEDLTDTGKRTAITRAALQSTATLKAARNAINKARDHAAELRKQVALPTPDPTDMVGFMRRQEIRDRLASMDDKARHEFVSKHASTNQDVGMAILEMPPEFTKVAGTDRELLVEATLEAAHGEKLVELREIEHAIEVANSAVEAGWENQAHEAEVFDLKQWEEMAKDIKAAEYIPWLAKSGARSASTTSGWPRNRSASTSTTACWALRPGR